MTVSSLAPWLGGFQCLPVINAVAPEAEGQVPGAASRLCGTNPRRRITGSRLQMFLYLLLPLVVVGRCQDEPSYHRGQGRPSAQPLPSTHGPQMQERLPWPHYRADTTWLTQRQLIVMPQMPGSRFICAAETQVPGTPQGLACAAEKALGLLRGASTDGDTLGGGVGSSRATRPGSRDLPLSPEVTPGQPLPRWARIPLMAPGGEREWAWPSHDA